MATREFDKRGDGEVKLGQVIAAGDVFKAGDTVTFRASRKDTATPALSSAITLAASPAHTAPTKLPPRRLDR